MTQQKPFLAQRAGNVNMNIENCSPQSVIPRMIKILKGNSARWLFLDFPRLKGVLWGGHLWNPLYCIVTVSDRRVEQIRPDLARRENDREDFYVLQAENKAL